MMYKLLLQVKKIKTLAAFFVLLFVVLIAVTFIITKKTNETATQVNKIKKQSLSKLTLLYDIRKDIDGLQLVNLKYVIETDLKDKAADEALISNRKEGIDCNLKAYADFVDGSIENILYHNILENHEINSNTEDELLSLDKADPTNKLPVDYFNSTQKKSFQKLQHSVTNLYQFVKEDTEQSVADLNSNSYQTKYNILIAVILMYIIILLTGFLIARTLQNLLSQNRLLKEQDLLLKREKQFSESLVIDSPNALVGVNEKGNISIFNKKGEELYGYNKEEIIGQSVMKLIPPKDHPKQEELMQMHFNDTDFRADNKKQSDFYGIKKDGTVINVELFISSIENEDGITSLTSVVDLTDKIEKDKKINQLADIVDNTQAFVAIATLEERVIYLNPAIKEALGILPEEDVTKFHINDFTSETEQKKKYTEKLPVVLKTGKWIGESNMISRNGTIIHLIQVIILNYNNKGEPISLSTTAIDITKIKMNEENLKKLTKDLRALYVKQMKLKEEERKVIAKEIHDVLGQNLTGIKMDAVWILKNIESGNIEDLKERAEQLKQTTEDTVQSSRQLYTHLYPQMLEEVGIVGAIRWNNKILLRNFKMNVKFNTELEEEQLFSEHSYICLALYRIYQECLTNIIRYAQAENVSIDLFIEEGEIVLSVKDDGIGFEPDAVDTKVHHGLIGMRERTYALNGKLVINSNIGKGTITTVSIPIPKEDD